MSDRCVPWSEFVVHWSQKRCLKHFEARRFLKCYLQVCCLCRFLVRCRTCPTGPTIPPMFEPGVSGRIGELDMRCTTLVACSQGAQVGPHMNPNDALTLEISGSAQQPSVMGVWIVVIQMTLQHSYNPSQLDKHCLFWRFLGLIPINPPLWLCTLLNLCLPIDMGRVPMRSPFAPLEPRSEMDHEACTVRRLNLCIWGFACCWLHGFAFGRTSSLIPMVAVRCNKVIVRVFPNSFSYGVFANIGSGAVPGRLPNHGFRGRFRTTGSGKVPGQVPGLLGITPGLIFLCLDHSGWEAHRLEETLLISPIDCSFWYLCNWSWLL